MQNILIFIQAYLLGRIGSRIIGLLLVLSLIWWAGPYVGLNDAQVRIYSICGVLLVFTLIWAIRYFIVKKRSTRFRKDLDKLSDQDQSRQLEIEELRAKMSEAIASLKSSELGAQHRGNAALYALPWFMIIGPSAAGKTTLLRNSGLNFPYAHDSDMDIRGFGGTRNCDWWFSNDAVLLDTAGRYTTEQDDHIEWIEFLAMLRKHRRRQPLNGAIVAISIAELLTADSKEIDRHVKIIRDRIDELVNHLGCVFPIYIVFTKCDLLYGFSSFFADLDEQEREQVWGLWLGHNGAETVSGEFKKGVTGLYRRLCELRLHKLSIVRKAATKNELFNFPSQFEAGKALLTDFVDRLTKDNPYQDTPNFCGIYLTSATQEGTPIQKILGQMRQAFGYVEEDPAAALPEPVSFFVKDVFKKVVFPNSRDVSRTRKGGIINRTLKTASILCALAIIIGSFLLLSTSLTMNSLLLNKGNSAAKELAAIVTDKSQDPSRQLTALGNAFDHYQTLLANEESRPLVLTLGVYEGDKQLPVFRSLLLKAFEHILFVPAFKNLERQLIENSTAWAAAPMKKQDTLRERYYQLLKTYLMLTQPEHLDKDYAKATLVDLIGQPILASSQSGSYNEKQQNLVDDLLSMALEYMQVPADHPDYIAPLPGDSKLIKIAQNNLKSLPDAKRLYAQLRNTGALNHPAIPLTNLITGPGQGILRGPQPIPYIYTARGWYDYVKQELKQLVHSACLGDWVTGFQPSSGDKDEPLDEKLVQRIKHEIRALYFNDYAETWLTLLEKVQAPNFDSIEDAAEKLLILARTDGPIAELFSAISTNINISETTLTNLELPQPANRIAELEGPLQDLRKLATQADKMTTSLLINQYLLALTSAQSDMEQLAGAVDVQQEAYEYSAAILGGDGASSSELYKCWLTTKSLTNGIDARTRKAATRLLNQPIHFAWRSILTQTRKHLQTQWMTAVYNSYRKKIAGKFPFDRQGSDASLTDITDFFSSHDGLIWNFTNNQLKPFLRKKRSVWQNKSWLGQGPNISAQFLKALPQAAEISAGLLRQGSPSVNFSIYPIPSSGLRMVRFESNGQKMVYQNEPQEWKHFSWPGDDQNPAAAISCLPSRDQLQTGLDFAGEWGLFHLLDEAEMTPEDNQYLVAWQLKTEHNQLATVRFKLRPDRQNNAFIRNLFTGFKLPAQIY